MPSVTVWRPGLVFALPRETEPLGQLGRQPTLNVLMPAKAWHLILVSKPQPESLGKSSMVVDG